MDVSVESDFTEEPGGVSGTFKNAIGASIPCIQVAPVQCQWTGVPPLRQEWRQGGPGRGLASELEVEDVRRGRSQGGLMTDLGAAVHQAPSWYLRSQWPDS